MASQGKSVSDEATEAARILSRYGSSLGGRARWKNVTSAERSDHFRRLSEMRWKQVRAQKSLENKPNNSSLQNPNHDERSQE